MPPGSTPTIRFSTSFGTSRGGGLRPSPFAQGFTLLFAAIILILLIPLVIIGIVFAVAAAVAAFLYITARRALFRLRAPNGALDGRKNVRVRMPGRDTDPTE